MKKPLTVARLFAFCCAAVLTATIPCALTAQVIKSAEPDKEIAAFLSSEIAPYLKAFQGFEKALGRYVIRQVLPKDGKASVMHGTRVAVLFGGRAAQVKLPRGVARVVCLAPSLQDQETGNIRSRVEMLPEPGVVLGKIRAMQPELRVLVAFWESEKTEAYLEDMAAAGKKIGLEVHMYKAADGKELYKTLKNQVPPGSAVWVSPDPMLINSENFSILKDFSFSRAVPLYVPTRGLAESGGTISISVSFEEMGRLTAEIAGEILKGKEIPDVIYPAVVEVSLNRGAAGKAGLKLTEKALEGVNVFN